MPRPEEWERTCHQNKWEENAEAMFQGGWGSETWEQKGVTWLKGSMGCRKHLKKRISSQEAFWATARRWILVHEQQEAIGVFCSGKASKKAIQNIEVYMPKAFPELKSERLNDEQRFYNKLFCLISRF